jgi:hypothetical protein
MRRLLLPLMVLAVLPFAAAANADCHEGEGCHPHDCIAWNPLAVPTVEEILAEPEHTLRNWLVPPTCP